MRSGIYFVNAYVGLMMGRLLVGATDFWPTMSGISSDGKEVKDTFGCLAEITLNTMLNILLMLQFLGVLHLSNLIQLYILSTPNGGEEQQWPSG